MVIVRRIYIFLVAAISLFALTYSVIALARDLLLIGAPRPVPIYALEIAVIVVTLPFFLVHWLWAQRLAARAEEERGSVLRRIYLYGVLAALLGVFVFQCMELLGALLRLALGTLGEDPGNLYRPPPPARAIGDSLVAIIVLAAAWLYHQWIAIQDARAVPETGNSAVVHRLYILSFSAVGLFMTAATLMRLLRWVLAQVGPRMVFGFGDRTIVADEISHLTVGLLLWLVFWLQAQVRFESGSVEERDSALRKFYLYLMIVAGAIFSVGSVMFILAEVLRQALGLRPEGDLRNPISGLIIAAMVWVYHYFVLRRDIALSTQTARQAGVRRLYLYLIAGIGLAAFLGGLIGVGRVIIQALAGATFGAGLKEELAYFTAALVTGLPVWLLPWRSLEHQAVSAGPAGTMERQSLVRKIYLYFYLFVASVTVLFSAIYVLFRLLSLALGDRDVSNLLSDLATALGFGLIGVAVWIYHGMALRRDGRLARREQVERLAATSVAVVDGGEGRWGRATVTALRRELPGLTVHPIGLSPAAAAAMEGVTEKEAAVSRLCAASLIIGPWNIAAGNGAMPHEIAEAILSCAGRKFIVPVSTPGWEWSGIERVSDEALAAQAVRTVKQVLEGEEVKTARSPLLIAIVVLIFACILAQVISMLAQMIGSGF